jgi:hypothetical protein
MIHGHTHVKKRSLLKAGLVVIAVLRTAKEISRLDSKSARWIGKDAIRELTSAAVQRRIRRIP